MKPTELIGELGVIDEEEGLDKDDRYNTGEEDGNVGQPELDIEEWLRDGSIRLKRIETPDDVGNVDSKEGQHVETPDEEHIEQCDIVKLEHHGRWLYPEITAERNNSKCVIVRFVAVTGSVIGKIAGPVGNCEDDESMVYGTTHPTSKSLVIKRGILDTKTIENGPFVATLSRYMLVENERDDGEKQYGIVRGNAKRIEQTRARKEGKESIGNLYATEAHGFIERILCDPASTQIRIVTMYEQERSKRSEVGNLIVGSSCSL